MEQGIVKETDQVDFTVKDYPIDADGTGAENLRAGDRGASPRRHSLSKSAFNLRRYMYHTPRIYPSKATSRLLALKNVLLPFRNVRFALFVGFIYFLYAWAFQVSAPPFDTKAALQSFTTGGRVSAADAVAAVSHAFWAVISPQRVMQAVQGSPVFFFMLLGLWSGLVYYVELGKGFINTLGKIFIGSAHFFMHLSALLVINLVAFLPTVLITAFQTVLLGGAAMAIGAPESSVWQQATFLLAYAAVSIAMGGFVGALIMGVYWTLTSTLLNMHCGDAFGALGIRDYKHFLRMRFGPDEVTIYPIALDKVPGRRGWRVATAEEQARTPSLILPKMPFKPHLIEPPIVIRAKDVTS